MIGVHPGGFTARHDRYGGPIFAVVGLLLLAGCTIWAALSEHGEPGYWMVTLAIVGVTTAWLCALPFVFPRRWGHPVGTLVFYLGVLVAAAALITRGDEFSPFASIGYPLAFALFPARWSVFGVAGTAVLPIMVKGGLAPDTQTPAWILVFSAIVPLLYAAWFVGAESDKRRKAIGDLSDSNAKLAAAIEENEVLHAQLLTRAREAGMLDERQRLAGEIHDTLAQGLTGIITQLQAAERAPDDEDRRRRLGKVHALARESLSEARRSVQALRPTPLTRSRLPEAVGELGRQFTETSGVPVRVTTTGDVQPMPPDLEVTLYRVAQEALANAGKHAAATHIWLTLSYSDDMVMLDVRDDGVGFALNPVGPQPSSNDGAGFGLQSMEHRLRRAAGTLAVESAPGEGTTVNAQVPLAPTDGGAA